MSTSHGQQIKAARKRAGLSQQELADRLVARGHAGDKSAISRIEAGRRAVSLGMAIDLNALIGFTWNQPVSGTDMFQEGYRQGVDAARQAVVSLQNPEHAHG